MTSFPRKLRKRGRCLWRPTDGDFIYLIQLVCIDEHSRERAGYSWARFFANIFHLVTSDFSVVITGESSAHSVFFWDLPKGSNSSKCPSFLIILSPLYWILGWTNQYVLCLFPNINFGRYWSVLDLISDLGTLPTGSSAIPDRSGYKQVLLILIGDTI